MRIYKRPGGKIWWAQFRGQRVSLHVTDQKAAEAAFRDLQRRDADPTYRPPDPSATLSAELAGFIARQREKGRAPGTITMYELHARSWNSVLGPNLPIASVDAAAVERYVSSRRRDGASKSTIWKELCSMRGALKRARKQGRYTLALDQVMPDDAQPEYKPGTRHLLLADVRKLVAELPPERQAVVGFLIAFAADLGSVWRAEAGDVTETAARIRGSKTTHRDRVVPVLPIFAEFAALARPPFKPWASIRRDLMRACTRLEIGDDDPTTGGRIITPRDLRRSHGRILRAAGVEPSLIGPMLGHAPGSRVTALSYAQIRPDELGKLIAARLETGTKTVQRKRKKAKKQAKKRAA